MYYNTINKALLYLLVFVFQFISNAQNVTIKGRAHISYANKQIQLYSYCDYITNIQVKESTDTIQADGFFELHYQTDFTQPIILKIENVFAKLYIQPNFVYGITIPEVEKDLDYKNDAELEINIGIIGKDSTELNALTYDYQEQYANIFILKNDKYLSRSLLFKRADSLKLFCEKRFSKIKNNYFKNYVQYSIASINASASRGENYLINGYLINKPIQYNHFEYMQFFNTCFKGYLNAMGSTHKGQSLYNIINVQANWSLLNTFLKQDKFLQNDSLRELVAIKNLWDFYYSADFSPDAIETITSQLNATTTIAQHKKITNTMLVYFNKMQVGSQAPSFSARSKDGTTGNLSNFKNRWIYLNFFSTKNIETLKEMPKIGALKKKFGDKLVFLSICLDDSLKSYTNYLKANPKFDWTIWYNYDKSIIKTAKENYFITGTEGYFLIDNFGYLAQSPALSPSGGIEYKLNVIFKIKNRTTKTGIR